MKAMYFVSDVHLGCGNREQEQRKIQRLDALLRQALNDATAIYFVGDLFDFWFEYRSVLPRGYHRILTAIEDLTRAGVEVCYLAGNHDFAIGRFFAEDLGVRVIRDDLSFEHAGVRFSLYHGDGLAPKDGGYRFLKRVLRNRVAQWGFRWLHPDLGFRLARLTSHTSRAYTGTVKQYGPVDGMRLDAARRMAAGADIVVMGHRHIPALERMEGGVYVNLGDWIRHYSYAEWRDGHVRLFSLADGEARRLDEV